MCIRTFGFECKFSMHIATHTHFFACIVVHSMPFHLDQIAGKYLEDSPQWQINESILRSRLDMELGDFELPFKEITSVCDIQDFAALLHGHDDNVALAIEWIVTKLKSFYPGYSGCATAERNLR